MFFLMGGVEATATAAGTEHPHTSFLKSPRREVVLQKIDEATFWASKFNGSGSCLWKYSFPIPAGSDSEGYADV